ncbi:MAG: hypothetical protein BM564_08260 [Bacteroidetes bacterium MedPE-SWsnd-G2]|nr:MAG: hypothetical protein BM564_08260 [Bacteroidetes bacterium MedPE-SWsnd-G2]
MAPIKLEDNIKNKMEERLITPSEASWGKLSKSLDEAIPEKKSNTFFLWGVAATIAGLALVALLWFQGGETNNLAPTIVNTPTINNQETIKPDSEIQINEQLQLDKKETQVASEEEKKDTNNPTDNTEKVIKSTSFSENKTRVAEINKTKPLGVSQKNSPIQNKVEVNGVALEQIEDKVLQESLSIEDEVNNLLKSAQEDVFRQKALHQNKRTITAEELLDDVEFEIEDSFRTKVFEVVKTGFKTVKTAVAERNN